jgi:hypothetical protein
MTLVAETTSLRSPSVAASDAGQVLKEKPNANAGGGSGGHELLSFLFRFAHKNLSTLDPDSFVRKLTAFRLPQQPQVTQVTC